MARDYYLVLGISRSADLNRIKQAYRRVAKKYHPDKTHTEQSAKKFREVREAYETLSDEEKRRRHDRELAYRDEERVRQPYRASGKRPESRVSQPSEGIYSHLDDWASGFVPGWFDRGVSSEKDLYCEVILSPREASQGGLFPLAVPVVRNCPRCNGAGYGMALLCPRCYGRGRVREKKEFSVSIPPQVRHGTEVRLSLEDIGLRNAFLHVAVFIDRGGEAFM